MRRSAFMRVMGGAALVAGLLTACGTTVPTNELQSPAGGNQEDAAPGGLPSSVATVGGVSGSAAASATGVTRVTGPTTGIPAGTPAAGLPAPAAGVSTFPTIAGGVATPGAKAQTVKTEPPATAASGKPKPTPKGSSSASATTGTAATTAAPILIGLTYQDNSGADAALGGVSPNSAPVPSPKTVSEAMVAGINATGGINGRMLKAIEYSFNTDTTSFDSDATAACDMFTQDNHVALVLDAAFGTVGGFEQCLQKAGVLDIGTFDDGDTVADQADTLHANTLYMTLDRNYASVLKGLTSTGYLSKTSQLGIVVEGCTEDTNAYTNTIVPMIKSLGLKPAVMTQVSCTTGFGSAEADSAGLSNAVLTFRGDGVDRVMFVSIYEDVLWGLFAVAASTQGYTPGYALSTLAEAHYTKASIPQSQWPQINGVGYVPGLDVDDTGIKPTAVENQCLSLVTAGQLQATDYDDDVLTYWYCAPFLLLESAAKADGYNYGSAALQASINALGTTLQGPGLLDDLTRYTGTQHDAPDEIQVFTEVASCSCVHYTGSPMAAPA